MTEEGGWGREGVEGGGGTDVNTQNTNMKIN